jgi:tetraacyldisaccharide 4'-kinase
VRKAIDSFLNRVWYEHSAWGWLIVPFSWLFACGIFARRTLYRVGILQGRAAGRPVIVVGNITAGGTGKTPVTIWLAENLKSRGLKPGIVSRGYGGRVGPVPLQVTDNSDPAIVGDEPLLMARRIVCPVAVHPDRVAAASLLADLGCDVIVADDGLQHYRLRRDFEIAVIDGRRGFGNRRLLPAGPLREPVARLHTVNRIMLQGSGEAAVEVRAGDFPDVTQFELAARSVHNLGGRPPVMLEAFRGKSVHAVAAIGNPRRFFDLLQEHGIDVVPHVLTDHAALTPADLHFEDRLAVLMTEKDAVKCGGFVLRNCWYVTVDLVLAADADPSWVDSLVEQVKLRQ